MAVSTLVGRVITMATADDTYAGKGVIDFISWVGGDTAADEAVLENTAGEVLWKASVSANGETVTSPPFYRGLPFVGLKAEDLDSGTLYVHLR